MLLVAKFTVLVRAVLIEASLVEKINFFFLLDLQILVSNFFFFRKRKFWKFNKRVQKRLNFRVFHFSGIYYGNQEKKSRNFRQNLLEHGPKKEERVLDLGGAGVGGDATV